MIKLLSESELKSLLKERKEKFERCRISNGKVTLFELQSQIEHKEVVLKEEKEKKVNIVEEEEEEEVVEVMFSSEDNTKATKSLSQKMKVGYFGKRRSRF